MKKSFKEKLDESPINYLSDLFVTACVFMWILTVLMMMIFSIYSTIVLKDTEMWSYVGILVAAPMSAGVAGWMVKNCIQHHAKGKSGGTLEFDFPNIGKDKEDE